MSEKHLDRLAAILYQAEHAATEEEANAYLTKAQELSTAYSIDLEVARQRQSDKTKRETPVVTRITIGKRGQKGLARYVELFNGIARANDVQINIAHNSTYVNAFGFPSDIAVVEALYASLVQQMVSASNEYLASGEYKNELTTTQKRVKDEYWGGYDYVTVTKAIDGRVARASFQESFTNAVRLRLSLARINAKENAAKETVVIDGVSTGKDMVLVAKAVEVSDFYKQNSTAKGSWKGSSSNGYSRSAASAGRSAGQSARIGSAGAIGGSRPALV